MSTFFIMHRVPMLNCFTVVLTSASFFLIVFAKALTETSKRRLRSEEKGALGSENPGLEGAWPSAAENHS